MFAGRKAKAAATGRCTPGAGCKSNLSADANVGAGCRHRQILQFEEIFCKLWAFLRSSQHDRTHHRVSAATTGQPIYVDHPHRATQKRLDHFDQEPVFRQALRDARRYRHASLRDGRPACLFGALHARCDPPHACFVIAARLCNQRQTTHNDILVGAAPFVVMLPIAMLLIAFPQLAPAPL